METIIKCAEFAGMFVGITALIVVVGGSVGIFFVRRGEKNAEREIKKYYAEVRERLRQKYCP